VQCRRSVRVGIPTCCNVESRLEYSTGSSAAAAIGTAAAAIGARAVVFIKGVLYSYRKLPCGQIFHGAPVNT